MQTRTLKVRSPFAAPTSTGKNSFRPTCRANFPFESRTASRRVRGRRPTSARNQLHSHYQYLDSRSLRSKCHPVSPGVMFWGKKSGRVVGWDQPALRGRRPTSSRNPPHSHSSLPPSAKFIISIREVQDRQIRQTFCPPLQAGFSHHLRSVPKSPFRCGPLRSAVVPWLGRAALGDLPDADPSAAQLFSDLPRGAAKHLARRARPTPPPCPEFVQKTKQTSAGATK